MPSLILRWPFSYEYLVTYGFVTVHVRNTLKSSFCMLNEKHASDLVGILWTNGQKGKLKKKKCPMHQI